MLVRDVCAPINADGVDDDDAFRENLLNQLAGIDTSKGVTIELTLANPVPRSLRMVYLLNALMPYDIDDIRDQNERGADIMKGLRDAKAPSKRVEEAMRFGLQSALKQLLRAYPVPLDVDKRILEEKALPLRKRAAVMHRMGEKKILQAALERAANM